MYVYIYIYICMMVISVLLLYYINTGVLDPAGDDQCCFVGARNLEAVVYLCMCGSTCK